MALGITTVADSISKLSISGVTVKDIDEIPERVLVRDGAVLYPRPDGFVTNMKVVPAAFGSAGTRKYTVTYTLHYMLITAPIGKGRGLFDVYSDLVSKTYLVIDAIIANDNLSGSVEFQTRDVQNFGPVVDPAGNPHHGCEIVVDVTEFVN